MFYIFIYAKQIPVVLVAPLLLFDVISLTHIGTIAPPSGTLIVCRAPEQSKYPTV
jgi:hypothetical protein